MFSSPYKHCIPGGEWRDRQLLRHPAGEVPVQHDPPQQARCHHPRGDRAGPWWPGGK